jgi:hypothetical protein
MKALMATQAALRVGGQVTCMATSEEPCASRAVPSGLCLSITDLKDSVDRGEVDVEHPSEPHLAVIAAYLVALAELQGSLRQSAVSSDKLPRGRAPRSEQDRGMGCYASKSAISWPKSFAAPTRSSASRSKRYWYTDTSLISPTYLTPGVCTRPRG